MAITSLALVRSGLQPPIYFVKPSPIPNYSSGIPFYSTQWGAVGLPAAGAYDTTLNGVALTGPIVGALPYNNPPSGSMYLARFQVGMSSLQGATATDVNILLCDRLWHNGGIDVTSIAAQTITSPTWPARDINGSTNGDGVLLMLETSLTVVGAATPNFTVSYTNSSGTSGRTGAAIRGTLPAVPATKASYPIALQAGDTGVRSVQSVTLDAAWTSGTINLVAYRLVSQLLSKTQANTSYALDAIVGAMPLLQSNPVLFFYWYCAAAANNNASPLSGNIQYAFG